MVAGITSGGQVGVVSMTAMRYAQSDGGAVIMPVRPAQLVYANFKHIQVRPDSHLRDGIPLYKLKILDTLIDQMSQKMPLPSVDAGTIDSTIMKMSRDFRAASTTGQSYRGGFLPAPGAFVDLTA